MGHQCLTGIVYNPHDTHCFLLMFRRHASTDIPDLRPPQSTTASVSSLSSSSNLREPSRSESVLPMSTREPSRSRTSGGGGVAVVTGRCLLHEVDLDLVSKFRASDIGAMERILDPVSVSNGVCMLPSLYVCNERAM